MHSRLVFSVLSIFQLQTYCTLHSCIFPAEKLTRILLLSIAKMQFMTGSELDHFLSLDTHELATKSFTKSWLPHKRYLCLWFWLIILEPLAGFLRLWLLILALKRCPILWSYLLLCGKQENAFVVNISQKQTTDYWFSLSRNSVKYSVYRHKKNHY